MAASLFILTADDDTRSVTPLSTDLAALKGIAEDHHRAEHTKIKPRCTIRDETGTTVAEMDEWSAVWTAPDSPAS